MAKQATDTFVAVLKDGSDRLVTKGEVFPNDHELVKRDAKGTGALFRDLDLGDADVPKSVSEAKAEPPAEAPVKAAEPAPRRPPSRAGKGP
jgi:hypothetical protein